MAGHQRSQPLPAKEEGLLKQVMKLYDLKQYKKGIKTADQVRCGLAAPCAVLCGAVGLPGTAGRGAAAAAAARALTSAHTAPEQHAAQLTNSLPTGGNGVG